MHSDVLEDDFISQLVNDGLSSVPWQHSTFTDDFILLAEFSELEGPKHIFTIPRDINSRFNLETFAVRIMSVDCVSILQTSSDLSSFNIAGDIQVVLSEVSEGAVAYVHHFVLYDIRARGYVRPYCLAYVTRNHTRLMKIFESLLQCFSLASSLFHFGNAMNFINDLVTRWQYLDYLNTVLSDKSANIYVDEKLLSVSQKESIMEKDIDENLIQITEIQKVFLAYLDRDVYNEHRDLFNDRYKQTCARKMEPLTHEKKVFSRDNNSISSFPEYSDSINTVSTDFGLSSTSHDFPEDVIASLLGKKYDKPLRQLNELCDVTYNSGLHILKYILKKHSTTNVNLSAGIKFKLPCNIEEAVETNLQSENPSCISEDRCFIPTRKSISLKQFLTASCCPVIDNRRSASAFEIENSFLSSLPVTSLEKPLMRNNSVKSNTGSFVSISSNFVNTPDTSPVSSAGSFRENYTSSELSRQTSLTTDSEYDKISLTRSIFSSLIQDNRIFDNTDILKYTRVSILGLKRKFSFLVHAVFSILIGRSVIVTGEEKHKHKVRHVVFGLANFLPCKGNNKTVIPWLNGPFSLNLLNSPGIIGILKCPKGRDVPNSLKPYVSILDVEDETLLAPRYDGKFLHDIFDPNTFFTSDIAFRQFILQSFAEMYSRVFIRFVKVYGRSEIAMTSPDHVSALSVVSKLMHKKEARGDEDIIVAFLNTMREEILQNFAGSFGEDVRPYSRKTMRLNNMKCTLFSNHSKRKR